MRRSPISRRTPMKRGGPLPKVNRKRAAKRKAECFGPQAELCRRTPCIVCLIHGPPRRPPSQALRDCILWGQEGVREGHKPFTDAHHETHTRGSGRGRDEHCIPLCRAHHDERGGATRADFEAKYGVDLRAIAARIAEALRHA